MADQSRAGKSARPEDLIKLDKSKPYTQLTSFEGVVTNVMAKEELDVARQKLASALDEAKREYQDGSDTGPRRGVRIALAAVGEFIKTADPQSGEKFGLFAMVLVAALADLDRGVVAPLFEKCAGYDRGKDSFGYKDIQMRAAATMAGLMDAGDSRDDAAKRVADKLAENGLDTEERRLSAITSATV